MSSLALRLKAPQIQHLLERHLAKVHRLDGRTRVHVLEAVRQGIHVLGAHQIGLGQENLVSKAHLAACFLAVVELLRCVLGVHQGDDGVDQVGLGDLFVHEERLRHRAGVGQAGGFDHDALKVQQALALLAASSCRVSRRSSRMVQQMQPLLICTICSFDSVTRMSLSMFSSPNSFSITAIFWPWASVKTRLSKVVLPEPKSP